MKTLQDIAYDAVDESFGFITGIVLVPSGDRRAVVLMRDEMPPLIVVVSLTLVTEEVVFKMKERITELGTVAATAGVRA